MVANYTPERRKIETKIDSITIATKKKQQHTDKNRGKQPVIIENNTGKPQESTAVTSLISDYASSVKKEI